MTTILITVGLVASVFFKTIKRIDKPELEVNLVSLDINPKGVMRTTFERSEFTQNQREAIAILEAGDIKMFNDYCSEVRMSLEGIEECLSEVTVNDINSVRS